MNTKPLALTAGALMALTLAALPGHAQPSFPDYDPDQLVRDFGLSEADQPVREQADWGKPNLVLVADASPARLAWLQSVAPGVQLRAYEGFDLAADGDQVDAVLGVCSAPVLDLAQLRWIQIYTAGAEKCLRLPAFDERRPLLTNMQRISAPVIAEHAVSLMLALSRQLPAFLDQQRDRNWSRSTPPVAKMRVVHGKTLLVVGLGGIGTQTARRAHALGMRVTATRDNSREGPAFVSEVGLPDDLPRLLGEADIVLNSLPLTPDTKDLFDAAAFGQMKRGALFVNVGRGGTVVTEDLRAALESGRLGGAGLDVTDPEPLPADHPLWQAPNLIITPHVAWSTDLDREARWQVVRENLRRYVNGGKMLSVVDPDEGY